MNGNPVTTNTKLYATSKVKMCLELAEKLRNFVLTNDDTTALHTQLLRSCKSTKFQLIMHVVSSTPERRYLN